MKLAFNPVRAGHLAEETASNRLQKTGLRLLARNYRCRYGETDLIMRDGETLVFIEVRKRSSDAYGSAAASIDKAKMKKLVRCAGHYLSVHYGDNQPFCRFDAVVLDGSDFNWIKNICPETGEFI